MGMLPSIIDVWGYDRGDVWGYDGDIICSLGDQKAFFTGVY